MVYGFAKQSHGHVKIESELGRGTSVKIFMPRSIADASGKLAPKPACTPERKEGNETILVVEDDIAVRAVVMQMLRGLGYQVREAVDPKGALAILDAGETVDLLFTDIVMPGGMSGWDLAEAAREKRPALKALFTSGYSDRVLKEHARIGVDIALLTKPYRARSLGNAIRAVLDNEVPALNLRRA
jgi:CheY-like chemotaxis protein